MISVGDLSPRSSTASGKAATVPKTRRSCLVVPRSTATAGMSSGNPDAMSFSARRGRVWRPMYTTSVVSTSAEVTANATGSTTALPVPSAASLAAPSLKWPVSSRTDVAAPLCVRGIPSSLPTPAAAVIPGTIVTLKPRFMSVSISSPPRPNTSGSPPFRRTTDAPFSANPRSMRSISSCVRVWNPACLPTYSMCAPSCTRSRIAGDTSRSYITTSAVCIRWNALSVSNPGSPGPVPTRYTLPASETGGVGPRASAAERDDAFERYSSSRLSTSSGPAAPSE
mmetsp:Transcript_11805/g.49473  ORF Transcript_11805/g.49473 Transcript_11805/m.49473 type:complete len:282 (+) Transcript_11805:608-1453(+)